MEMENLIYGRIMDWVLLYVRLMMYSMEIVSKHTEQSCLTVNNCRKGEQNFTRSFRGLKSIVEKKDMW